MRNAGLDEVQAGIKISGRNKNNLRYADDTTLMAESEELKSLLVKVKEESENLLKLNIRKTKIVSFGPIRSDQIRSVAQSCPTLQPHGPQHARPPCPAPTPGVHPNPCPLSQ